MSDSADVELKAGHPPAVKVGNVRQARSRGSSGSGEKLTSQELAKQQEEFGTDVVPKPTAGTVVAGQVVKVQKAYPEKAVRSYHEKPHSSLEKPHHQPQHRIQQPRKQ